MEVICSLTGSQFNPGMLQNHHTDLIYLDKTCEIHPLHKLKVLSVGIMLSTNPVRLCAFCGRYFKVIFGKHIQTCSLPQRWIWLDFPS